MDTVEQDRGYETPCKVWLGAPHKTGYASTTRAGGSVYLHRKAYEEARGPVPPGLELDHLCGVKNCLNVEHLEPVTHAENIRRCAHTKLTVEDVREIRGSSLSQVELAKKYGVTNHAIWRVVHRHTWKDVD
jgi:hypothetical protein